MPIVYTHTHDMIFAVKRKKAVRIPFFERCFNLCAVEINKIRYHKSMFRLQQYCELEMRLLIRFLTSLVEVT